MHVHILYIHIYDICSYIDCFRPHVRDYLLLYICIYIYMYVYVYNILYVLIYKKIEAQKVGGKKASSIERCQKRNAFACTYSQAHTRV
jgi:hypothetical protein